MKHSFQREGIVLNEQYDKNRTHQIGIDKIQIYNLGLEWPDSIDFKKLTCHDCVKIEEDGMGRMCFRRLPGENKGISKIVITDNKVFSDLIIGCTYDGVNKPHEYIYLTMTVDNAKGNNLYPMLYSEYCDYLKYVLSYIAEEYGIKLRAYNAKIRYIEINATILLKEEFAKYNRALRLLMSFPSKRFGKLSTYDSVSKKGHDKKLEDESFKRGNKSIELVIYDKSKQIQDRKKLPFENKEINLPPYLRIEYRLLNQKKVEKELGSVFWNDLNDEKVANYFISKIDDQLLREYEAWQQTRQKDLLKLIKCCRKNDPKRWHSLLMQEIRNLTELNGIPYILDIEQVYDAIHCIPNSSRYCNRTIHAIDKIQVENDIYKNHDLDKIREIFDSLKAAYIASF